MTPQDPVMSSVDITFSPAYSASSTSGTSGCQNWDFANNFIEKERINYVFSQKNEILIETAIGEGPHLDAFSVLMSCDPKVQKYFNKMLKDNFFETNIILKVKKEYEKFPLLVKNWIYNNDFLKDKCLI